MAGVHGGRIIAESIDSRDLYFARSFILSPMYPLSLCVKILQGMDFLPVRRVHFGDPASCLS
jgi:hypothetical protein